MEEEIEARQHVLFGELNSGLTIKAKHATEAGQKDRTAAGIKKK